jgi:hypothetical protein
MTLHLKVEVTALSSYEHQEDTFKEEVPFLTIPIDSKHGSPDWQLFGYKYSCFCIQVAKLRQRFYNSVAPGGLAGDRRGAVSATGFSISAQEIWKAIRQNKDLDLPAHKVFNNIISRCNTGLTS